MSLNLLDWSIIAAYFMVLMGMGVVIGRTQKSEGDYFLGGRAVPSPAVALSIMATQCGSISIISAPAFVALREGGGLRWLQYEFAVPLAMVVLMLFFLPCFYRLSITTVYEYLERRFSYRVRWIMSALFQLSRGLATGVALYAVSIVTAVCFSLPLWSAIILTGVISTLYTMAGGIKAVIYTDALQIVVLWVSVFICVGFCIAAGGGWESFVNALKACDLTAVDFHHHGFGDGHTFSFWPMLLGGLFLYISYYGCDQSQMQRVLCTRSLEESNRSLFINGLLRFPLVLSYCLLGVSMMVFLSHNPDLKSAVPPDRYDYLIPLFIVRYLPHGIIGFIVTGIFAASMSSIDSAVNSLSAATIKDLLPPFPRLSRRISGSFVYYSRITTLVWGSVCTACAFLVGTISPTVIESINMIGSVFYGPVLATFALGIFTRTATGSGVIVGLGAGIALNLVLWIFFPAVSWLWWNLTGCGCTYGLGIVVSMLQKKVLCRDSSLVFDFSRGWYARLTCGTREHRRCVVLSIYFALIVGLSLAIGWW